MELNNLERWYDEKGKTFCFFFEISYSSGKVNERKMIVNLQITEHLIWNNQAQDFNFNRNDYKDAFEASYALV